MNELYIQDSYMKEFDAKVVSVKDDKCVILDKTAFYPNSGGQPNDEGTITRDGEEFKVVFVGKFEDNISHEVDHSGLKVGENVHCKINWNRRYFLMRNHTAAHVLSTIIHNETGAKITGNQLGLEKSRIDFSLDKFDREKFVEYVKKFNEFIKEDIEVKTRIISRLEAEKIPSLVRLAKGLDESIQDIRVVEIDGFDSQACGGTHVKNLNEIGTIEIVKLDNKGQGKRRIYFKLKEKL